MADPTLGHYVDFRILGPLEVRAAGRTVDLGGPKPRTLLAVLLLDPGEIVSTDRLIEELWGERPPRSARHLLYVYVSSLRKALLAAGARPLLVSRSPWYVLELRRNELDAARFEQLVADGRRLNAAGDPAGARASLRPALRLWRGDALADFTYEPFAQAEIARLEELRFVAREERVAAELALGQHQELVGELEAIVTENPLRERFREQLMLALYRCGRQAEALESYRAARRILVGELGIEPGPSLRRIQQAILRQDESLNPPSIRAQTESGTGSRSGRRSAHRQRATTEGRPVSPPTQRRSGRHAGRR